MAPGGGSLTNDSVVLGGLRFHGEPVPYKHKNLSKMVAARHKARIFPAVFARSVVTNATTPELFVPVVFRDDLLVASGQEQGAEVR